MKLIEEIKTKVTNKVEAYQEIKNRFDAEINRLESEILMINEAVKETRTIIEEKAMNLEDTTAEECQVEEAAGVLKRLTERLELAKRGKRQALASQVPAIKRFFEEKREAVKVDIENQIEIINRTRAALLKEIQKLYEIDAKAVKLNAELNGIVRENGEKVNEYQTGSLIEGQFYLTDDWVYFGKDTTAEHLLGIPQWMVQDAKRGIIPQPLKKYFD